MSPPNHPPKIMNTHKRLWMLSLLSCLMCVRLAAEVGQVDYDWKPMKVGGGGYVVGLYVSPTVKGLAYARTDVSGAYRWDAAAASWKQLVTSASMPAEHVSYGQYGGVVSLVGAPRDSDIAYMAFKGEIFRSVDRGEHWTATSFGAKKVAMDANGEGRQEGERLGVDPANSNLVYFCPTQGPLWRTEDGGQTWSPVKGIPEGQAPHGVNTVVFDPRGGAIKKAKGEGKTQVIYVTVDHGGIFRSTDAGVTWRNIAGNGPGDVARPRDAEVGPDGTYYVACDNAEGAQGSVWKFTGERGWTNITPSNPEGGNQSYWDVAVDPTNGKRVVAMENGGKGFVSENQGAKWTYHLFHLNSREVTWLDNQERNYFLSVGELEFDPFDPGKLWFAEGLGVWWTKDLSPLVIEWEAASKGIEETCTNELIAPPGGKPVGAVWDNSSFYFTDPDTYTAVRSHPTFMAGWALDWCPANPKFITGIFQNNLNFGANPKMSGYSMDGGQTWTRFVAIDAGALPAELEYGVIAVSADNPDNLVWCPAAGKLPHYSTDRGVTWKRSDCGRLQQTGLVAIYKGQRPLCADRVSPATFYLYTSTDGVYRSTDGGAHFKKVGELPGGRESAKLKATPGKVGHLWFAEGAGGRLLHSKDAGATWTMVTGNIEHCINVGLGKALNPDGYPTLFAGGVVAGRFGIYRSTDEGTTWSEICSYPLGVFEWINCLEGDKDVFGKVYLGFAQAGFAYGQPR